MQPVFKVKEGLILKDIDNACYVVPVGKLTSQFRGIMSINQTTKELWPLLEKGATKEDLVSKLTSIYDVSIEKAQTDIEHLIEVLSTHQLFEADAV